MIRQLLQKLLIYLFIIIPSVGYVSAESVPDISGTWILNIQLSDDFQEKIKEQVKSARNNRGKPDGYSGASGKGRGGGSGGRPSGVVGGRPSGAKQHGETGGGNMRATMKKELGNTLLFLDNFQIIQNDPEIIMSLSESKKRIIYTDGRGITVTSNGSSLNPMGPYIAGWEEDNQLVIETTTNKGIKVEEFFVRSQDGKQLHTRINIKLPGFVEPIKVDRIYDLNENKMVE